MTTASPFKTFISRFSHFLSGNLLTKLLGFITLPVLTRLLTTEQYGILSLATTTIMLWVVFAKAGLSEGIFRYYRSYSETQEKLIEFSSTVLIRGLILSVLTFGVYFVMLFVFKEKLKIENEYVACFVIIAFFILIRPLDNIVSNLMIVTGKTIFLNVIGFMAKIVSFCLSLFFFFYIVKGIYGYLIGSLLSEVVLTIVLFYWFFKNYTIDVRKSSWPLAGKLIKFGAPLLLTELSYLLLSYADRYMIIAYRGEDALGIYSVGYNIAMYISDGLIFALSYTIVPIFVEMYEKKGRQETEAFLNKCMYYVLVSVIIMTFGYFPIARDLFTTLASNKYGDAAVFSPIILISNFILGLSTNMLNAGLYLEKKSVRILVNMLIALIINIILNVILIPQYGVIGAAIATLLACIALAILTIQSSFKYISYNKFDIKKLSYYVALSIIMVVIVTQINTAKDWVSLIAKVATGVVIVISGVLFQEKELLAAFRSYTKL